MKTGGRAFKLGPNHARGHLHVRCNSLRDAPPLARSTTRHAEEHTRRVSLFFFFFVVVAISHETPNDLHALKPSPPLARCSLVLFPLDRRSSKIHRDSAIGNFSPRRSRKRTKITDETCLCLFKVALNNCSPIVLLFSCRCTRRDEISYFAIRVAANRGAPNLMGHGGNSRLNKETFSSVVYHNSRLPFPMFSIRGRIAGISVFLRYLITVR